MHRSNTGEAVSWRSIIFETIIFALIIYIIGVNRNIGQGKGYPISDQIFWADFHKFLFNWIAFKLIEILSHSHPDHSRLPRLSPGHLENYAATNSPCATKEIWSLLFETLHVRKKLGLRPPLLPYGIGPSSRKPDSLCVTMELAVVFDTLIGHYRLGTDRSCRFWALRSEQKFCANSFCNHIPLFPNLKWLSLIECSEKER